MFNPLGQKNDLSAKSKKRRQDRKKKKNDIPCYVGSAYQCATDDMARNPHQWNQVREECGFWLHGNIFDHLMNRDESILRQFVNKSFIMEGDIGWLEDGNTCLPFIFDWMKQRGYKCDGVAITVPTDRIVRNPEQVAKDLDALLTPVRSKGAKCYLLMQVISAESTTPEAVALLRNGYKGERVWNYIVKRSKTCSGTVLDHPALHWSHVPQHNDIAVDFARSSLSTLGKNNFTWLLNGGTCIRDTQKLLNDLKAADIVPSNISVSHFHLPDYRGTPENGESVTGQALEALKFYN